MRGECSSVGRVPNCDFGGHGFKPHHSPQRFIVWSLKMRGVIVAITLVASSTWVMADEVKCLAQNIYWEARNQSIQGMYAVADVTLNRVKDKRWPGTVCEVVKQRKNAGGKWVCQFSWFCDGLSDTPKRSDLSTFNLCTMIAYVRLKNKDSPVLPRNIYWYHANTVNPYWADAYSHHTTIGDHRFYSEN